ncbi:hypothetical protein BU17DRAFT_64266 [Hysterangium stoloniferum]|nr:hypothetical protein BU17DRAFT_64266 [Hysterangium stoloniferum]
MSSGIIEASGDFLSNKNAINWVNAENFQHFVVEWLQVPTPCTPQIIESSTSASALPLRQYKQQRGSSTSSEHSVVIANKRLRRVSISSEYPPPITWVTPNKSTGTPAKKHARYSKHQVMTDAGWIQITRQQWVKQLVELTEIPTTWPIPMEGESIGYILDLTNSTFKFIDSNGNPLSMAAIIKNKCVDGWGDGSGGTKDAGPVIFPLGKIKTQRAIHVCRGHFMCSRVDSSLFFKYEHYSDDFKTFEEIHNAQMTNNAAEADLGQPIIQTFERGSTSRDTEKYTGPCYYTIPPTVGLKQEKCPHIHFENGKLLNGLITQHHCHHNHTWTPPQSSPLCIAKLTFEATELYVEAIETVGLLGSTVGQIDRGVKHMYENIELKRPIDIVVTMLPDLAELVHNVTSTQHDTTYKHIFGAFNEWEIVIWHPYLCRHESTYSLILIFIELRRYSGVAIGRIYCNRETRQAYHLIWTEWFKAIERVTNKSVEFKALHKEGKHAIFMVDSSAPQMQGLGDFLLTQNDPLVSRIATKDPQIIVHGFEPLKAVCSHEDYNHIAHFQYITTQEKMDEFTAWCLGHEQPKVQDWWRNKLAYPWYIPALCRHFSKVPSADWDLRPTNTNLNQQSHQATNRATGVHIPLAEAIDRFLISLLQCI